MLNSSKEQKTRTRENHNIPKQKRLHYKTRKHRIYINSKDKSQTAYKYFIISAETQGSTTEN